MGKTYRGFKGAGLEYWSRRAMSGHAPGRNTKRVTNKKERLTAKADIRTSESETVADGIEREIGSFPEFYNEED